MQVVVITGASKGIGLEIARTLQRHGYTVIGTSRKPFANTLEGIIMLPLDVTSGESVDKFTAHIEQSFGRIDVLINNAGYDLYGAAEETPNDVVNAQMETNFMGAVRMIRAVLPLMRRQRSGRIINISSIGGFLALPFNSAYAASKFALEGYSESLRYEVRQFGIHVSLVEPGSVNTETLHTSIVEVDPGLTVYAKMRSNMVRQMRLTGTKSRVFPHHVATTILHILRTSNPRLRYTVGALAWWMPRMKWLLPQAMLERFISRQFVESAASGRGASDS
jgi:NAD(P)-dependent dehydrogenase (short-subunit alcohol dehydrogenase family)